MPLSPVLGANTANAAAIALGLVAWGAHALSPWRLARAAGEARRPYALAALPLLVASIAAGLAWTAFHPDAAVATGVASLRGSRTASVIAILVAAALLADLVAAFAWRDLEPAGWRILGGLHLAASLAVAFGGELLRIGEGPRTAFAISLLAIAARWLLMLASGEALAPGRPRASLLAVVGMPLYLLALPTEVLALLWERGVPWTAGAATLLFLAARWLPSKLRRPAVGVAALLAGVVLAQAAAASELFGNVVAPPRPPPKV
jgi:hypothetical protein